MIKAWLLTIMMVTNTHIEADRKLEQIAMERFETFEECKSAEMIWRDNFGELLDAHISTRYYMKCAKLDLIEEIK